MIKIREKISNCIESINKKYSFCLAIDCYGPVAGKLSTIPYN